MTVKRDKPVCRDRQDSRGTEIRDVTLLCSDSNVVSHPACFDAEARLEAFRRSIGGLSPSELKRRYEGEYNCFRAMKERERKGRCSVHLTLNTFPGFLSVLGPKPAPTATVDRKNNEDREYAPGKVHWASKRTQANNRRTTVMLTDRNGLTLPLSDWARRTNQNANTMRQRRKRG